MPVPLLLVALAASCLAPALARPPLLQGALALAREAGPHGSHGIGCQQSLADSDNFFCTGPIAWQMRKQIARDQWRVNRLNASANHTKGGYGYDWYLLEEWEAELHCMFQERLGPRDHNGKIVCDPYTLDNRTRPAWVPNNPCLVYSIGSNNEFGFENALLEWFPNCEVHTFDHTSYPPDHAPGNNPNIKFHPWGLSNTDYPPFKSLPSIIRELGHEGREISILKIDAEGAEYEAFPPLLSDPSTSPLRNVRQLLLEIHFPPMITPSLAPLATQKAVNDMFIGLHRLGFGVFAKIGVFVSGVVAEFGFIRVSPTMWELQEPVASGTVTV